MNYVLAYYLQHANVEILHKIHEKRIENIPHAMDHFRRRVYSHVMFNFCMGLAVSMCTRSLRNLCSYRFMSSDKPYFNKSLGVTVTKMPDLIS